VRDGSRRKSVKGKERGLSHKREGEMVVGVEKDDGRRNGGRKMKMMIHKK
jgi:hypothetical protein